MCLSHGSAIIQESPANQRKRTEGHLDHTGDALTVLSWREIFDKLEACADACEHVGDCIETIVMKNT